MSVEEHTAHAPLRAAIRVGVITVSDTRTLQTDEGGRLVVELCQGAGMMVASRTIVPDEPTQVADRVRALVRAQETDAILLTGGTGLARRDSTVEALAGLFEKTIPGYGELFRALSFANIGPAAMLSRAMAGTVGHAVVFLMPGSPAGVRLALEKLILPELPHIVAQVGHHPAYGHGKHSHR